MEVETQEEMPYDEEMGNEEVTESGQEEESYEDESQVDTSSDEESDDQESDSTDYKKLLAETEAKLKFEQEEKRKAQEWTRSIQSASTKKVEDIQRQFEEFTSKFGEQEQEQDYLNDDYDEPMTQRQMAKYLDDRERKKSLSTQKDKTQRERQIQEKQERDAEWLRSQPGYEEVNKFYNGANLINNPEFKQITETQGQYYFAKYKQLEADMKRKEEEASRRAKKRKKVPPTGNTGKHYKAARREFTNSIEAALHGSR